MTFSASVIKPESSTSPLSADSGVTISYVLLIVIIWCMVLVLVLKETVDEAKPEKKKTQDYAKRKP